MVERRRRYLCCGEEDVIRYVAYSTSNDTQSNSGEDVGIVSLAGDKGASVSHCHFVKRTSTGKDAPALERKRGGEGIVDKSTSVNTTERFRFTMGSDYCLAPKQNLSYHIQKIHTETLNVCSDVNWATFIICCCLKLVMAPHK